MFSMGCGAFPSLRGSENSASVTGIVTFFC